MRGVAVVFLPLLLGGGLAFAQPSALPAMLPTSEGQRAAPVTSATGKTEHPAHRAEVVYSGNQLQVTANNASLNQILREIARQTGMKITGGVSEERVYGRYGPAAPGVVLASLLQGTGSNMLLRETPQAAPTELILTVRNGGPTPPNPNASGFDDETQSEPPTPAVSQPVDRPAPATVPGGTQATQATPPAGPSTDVQTLAPTTGTDGPASQSPNGVKTPQEIYLELQQLRQQQQVP